MQEISKQTLYVILCGIALLIFGLNAALILAYLKSKQKADGSPVHYVARKTSQQWADEEAKWKELNEKVKPYRSQTDLPQSDRDHEREENEKDN